MRDRRGTATAEAALVMIVMLFFLMLAPVVLRIWETEHALRAEAHRDVFHKLTIPVHAGDQGTGRIVPVEDTRWGVKNQVAVPAVLNGRHYVDNHPGGWWFGFGQKNSGVTELPNTFVEGWEGRRFRYGNRSTFSGEMEITRRAVAIRPSWARTDWPYVTSQITLEAATVEQWYKDREREAMAYWPGGNAPYGDIREGLKVQDTFFTFLWGAIKDEIKQRLTDMTKKALTKSKKSKSGSGDADDDSGSKSDSPSDTKSDPKSDTSSDATTDTKTDSAPSPAPKKD